MKLKELYRNCRTIRRFRQEEIPEEDLIDIIDSVRYAHSGNNKQKLRYYLVQSDEGCKACANLVHYAALLPHEIGEPKENESPTAYIVIASPEDSKITHIDAGIASQMITATAYEKGIGSCIIVNFVPSLMDEALHISEGYYAMLVVALGYPACTSVVEECKDMNTAYWIDEDGGWHVPKLSVKDLVRKR